MDRVRDVLAEQLLSRITKHRARGCVHLDEASVDIGNEDAGSSLVDDLCGLPVTARRSATAGRARSLAFWIAWMMHAISPPGPRTGTRLVTSAVSGNTSRSARPRISSRRLIVERTYASLIATIV